MQIEVDYRAGIKSLEQIGSENGLSKGRISQVAKKFGWVRDLREKIRAKAEAKLNKEALNKKLNEKPLRLAEAAVVEANAEQHFQIQLSHRVDIARARGVFQKLLGELEQTTDNRELFEALGDLMNAQAESAAADKLNQIYRKVIGLQGRIASGKELTLMLEKVIGMERQAFGMDKEQGKVQDGLTSLLQAITSGTASTFKPVARDPEHDEDD